jgi:RimJ/RimL family protein N-acetyltransferase
MSVPTSWPVVRSAARFYLRPAHRALERVVTHRGGSTTWGIRLGPLSVNGHEVVLRSPRVQDGAAWREVRLRERDWIEPWWSTSQMSWESRHDASEWVANYLAARRAGRTGRALPLVVECDGEFAGQCNLERIDHATRSAEMGAWLDSRLGRTGVSTAAARLLIDHAFVRLRLHRLTGPICEGNVAAAWGARRLGMVCEGKMSGFLDVGGRRRDHYLWALTADRYVPPRLPAPTARAATPQRVPHRRATGECAPAATRNAGR